jgi:hypothetical protein
MLPSAAPGFGGIRRRPQRDGRGILGEGGTLALQLRIVAVRLDGSAALDYLAVSLLQRSSDLCTEITVTNTEIIRKVLEIPWLPIF